MKIILGVFIAILWLFTIGLAIMAATGAGILPHLLFYSR